MVGCGWGVGWWLSQKHGVLWGLGGWRGVVVGVQRGRGPPPLCAACWWGGGGGQARLAEGGSSRGWRAGRCAQIVALGRFGDGFLGWFRMCSGWHVRGGVDYSGGGIHKRVCCSEFSCAPPPPASTRRDVSVWQTTRRHTREHVPARRRHTQNHPPPARRRNLDPRIALEGNGPQRRPQKRLDRRLEEAAKAVGGGYCQLQTPLRLSFGVRETVAGHMLSARKGEGYLHLLPMHPCPLPQPRQQTGSPRRLNAGGGAQNKRVGREKKLHCTSPGRWHTQTNHPEHMPAPLRTARHPCLRKQQVWRGLCTSAIPLCE